MSEGGGVVSARLAHSHLCVVPCEYDHSVDSLRLSQDTATKENIRNAHRDPATLAVIRVDTSRESVKARVGILALNLKLEFSNFVNGLDLLCALESVHRLEICLREGGREGEREGRIGKG